MQDMKIKVTLEDNAGAYAKNMGGATKATEDFGGAARGVKENTDSSGRAMSGLKSLASEAASSFLGFASAQGIMMGVQKAVSFVKETVLDFDDALTQSVAIMGNVGAGVKQALGDTARQVAVQYNESVAKVAQGYYFLVSAGYDVETSQKAIGQVTAFAKAGMIDLEKATELAADAQNAMGLKSDDAGENLRQLTRITDVLTKANVDANGSVEQFAEALTNKAASSARLMNVSLEETVAVLEAFAAQGLKGLKAGEAFSILLRDLPAKARKNTEAFADMGITVFDANGAFAGFPTIVGQVEKALEGLSVQQIDAKLATLELDAESAAFLKTLLGTSAQIGKYEEGLKKAGGTTQEVARKQMQSLVEQLKHIQAEAAELGLKGFDGIIKALGWLKEQFGPSLEAGAVILRELGTYVGPLAKNLALLGGGAVVGALMGLAKVLNTVLGLLKDNEVAVKLLADAGMAYLTYQALATASAYVQVAQAWAAIKWAQGSSAVLSVAQSFGAAYNSGLLFSSTVGKMGSGLVGLSQYFGAAYQSGNLYGATIGKVGQGLTGLAQGFGAAYNSGTLAASATNAFRSGLSGLSSVLRQPIVQIGLLTAAIYGVIDSFQKSDESAKAMVTQLTKNVDTSNIRSMDAAVKNMQGTIDGLNKQLYKDNAVVAWGKQIADFIPWVDIQDNAQRTASELDQVSDSQGEMARKSHEAKVAILELAAGMSPLWEKYSNTKPSGVGVLTAQADAAARGLPAARAEVQGITDDLWKLAQANDIDLSQPVETWKDRLQEAYQVTTNATPAFLQLRDSFKQVADGAADAEDRVKAYQQALGALVGVHVSADQAENSFAASLDKVHESLNQGINLNDAYGAANRAARDSVLSATDSALNHAVAVYQESGSLDKANATLAQHREQLIVAATQTGMTRQAAEAYIDTLGLTPTNILTLAQLNKEQAAAKATELQGQLNTLDKGSHSELTANGSQAIAEANRVRASYEAARNQAEITSMLSAAERYRGQNKADGGVTLHAYARGGLREEHQAQISRGMRLWAEPETGGEAYIPLAMSKRDHSENLLETVASMFGYQLVKRGAQRFATGGLSVAALGAAAGSGGGVTLLIASGAVQVNVRADAGVDRTALARAVREAVRPALDEWTRSVQTEMRTRGRA